MNKLTTLAPLPSAGGCMSSLPAERTVVGIDLASGDEISIVEHFATVRVKRSEWADPEPQHIGERILWADGSVHGMPEDDGEYVTVLRRVGAPEVHTVAMRSPYFEDALKFPEIDHEAIPAPADKHGFEPFEYCERS